MFDGDIISVWCLGNTLGLNPVWLSMLHGELPSWLIGLEGRIGILGMLLYSRFD